MQYVKQRNSIIIILFLALMLHACKNENRMPDRVTFTEHIAPILYNNCTICHRPGGTAHFDLVTYQQAKNSGSALAYVCRQGIMPPWPADPHYTEFVGQRTISEHEIRLLEKWVLDGMEEGPKDKMPKLPEFPTGSLIGKPDMRIPVQPYTLPANSVDKFLIIKVPFELPRDTYASVVEFMPGSNNIVHHVNGDMVEYDFDKKKNVFEGDRIVDMVNDSTIKQAFEKLGLPNDDGTYPKLKKSVVNYLPGVYGQRYPEGIGGFRLPRKGAFLLNDLHYGFTKDKAITDSSYINIFFAKTPPNRPVEEFQLGTIGISPVLPDLVIQPNTVKSVYSKFTVPEDISVLTVNPHMHLLGKSFKAYALQPNGDTIRLISIPRWDFNWQYFYTFKHMVKIPKGSTIVAEGVYDNTKQNLNNPFTPPRLIRDNNGSMKATDEMFQFIITYLPYQSGDENISLDPNAK
ncbi:MAG: hypothetical protein BGO70_16985 [Bacteroidetes bacterium 43-93]|nr:hypothetical protein [Bacteroidota bacterium]OJX01447.1 MAG: hypothetical protein BGO70_16985 [Bacteroidetes bacterium 43-93]